MSSPMNNNTPVSGIAAPTNSIEFASQRRGISTPVNVPTKMHTRSQHEQPGPSSRGRPGRSNRGRGGPTNKFSNPQRYMDVNQQPTTSDQPTNEDGPGQIQNDARSGIISTVNSRSRNNRSAASRGGNSGKYRQRQQTNQLIDGMNGLDIDLVESIAPSCSEGQTVESSKGRHATNSRKVNLTHLLNYQYERKQRGGRHRNASHHDGSGGNASQRNSYRDPGSFHKFSKQQFLQANCQFVVLDGYDCSIHKVDPDWPVDWDYIEEVKFRQTASTETTCPICLEPPMAAKITRCGHIYCWTCMLHYLSLSDENCRQCPICFEPVYQRDLRSVVSQTYSNHAVGEEIVMKLMVRNKGCVEVEAYAGERSLNVDSIIDSSQIVTENDEHYFSQANLVIVDPLTVITKITQREKDELMMKMALDHDEPEVCFIEQALDVLNKRAERLYQMSENDSRCKGQSRRMQQSNIDSAGSYLFYQCSDGQHIYLNPFSTKILCHEFGSLENCPSVIRASILQMDWVSMSDGWRKRFKYLEHLPLTCEFRLIEIDFEKSRLVSCETYQKFEDQINMRAQEREKRRREERKREKIIQVEQNRRIYGIQPSLKINLDNTEQFPSVSDERYLGLSKKKNLGQSEEGYISSDDDDDNGDLQRPSDSNATNSVPEAPNVIVPSPGSSVSPQVGSIEPETAIVALSFKDIQLQEAIKEANLPINKTESNTGIWSNNRQVSGSTGPQSSFAKLLEGAKTSQKEWTRNVHVSAPGIVSATQLPGQTNVSVGGSGLRPSSLGAHSTAPDEGREELRAPPSEFTISDFIDFNVVSNAGKRKGKSKSACKKG